MQSQDATVKRYGITLATKMIKTILDGKLFNLQVVQKSVRTIMENLGWVASRKTLDRRPSLVIEQGALMPPNTGDSKRLPVEGAAGIVSTSIRGRGIRAQAPPTAGTLASDHNG